MHGVKLLYIRGILEQYGAAANMVIRRVMVTRVWNLKEDFPFVERLVLTWSWDWEPECVEKLSH